MFRSPFNAILPRCNGLDLIACQNELIIHVCSGKLLCENDQNILVIFRHVVFASDYNLFSFAWFFVCIWICYIALIVLSIQLKILLIFENHFAHVPFDQKLFAAHFTHFIFLYLFCLFSLFFRIKRTFRSISRSCCIGDSYPSHNTIKRGSQHFSWWK